MAKQKQAIVTGSNDADAMIQDGEPYTAIVSITGTTDLIMHRYSVDSVAEKSKALKGSKGKKTDDIESYVYRSPTGGLIVPATCLLASVRDAGRSVPDPRSPRKSSMDLIKCAIIGQRDGDLGAKTWDRIDRRRVCVQRAAITRERPAMLAGWRATFELGVIQPEYVTMDFLAMLLQRAGAMVGVLDFRPTYGRFRVESLTRKALLD